MQSLETPDILPCLDAEFVLNYSTTTTNGQFDEDVTCFLNHLTFDEIVGKEKCNPEYYGYPPFEDSDEAILFSSNLNSMYFATTKTSDEFDTFAYAVSS